MEFKHVSVLKEECIDGLNIQSSGTYVDGTLGGAGHASEVVARLNGAGRFIGIDQDEEAIENGIRRLEPYKEKVTLVRDNFQNFQKILADLDVSGVDGILLDLGVSSRQLDEGERGFSYMQDAPLDMRMDRRQEFSAKELVAQYSEEQLARIIADYGEERWAKRIAQFIVTERKK